jgi:hypothetical protein
MPKRGPLAKRAAQYPGSAGSDAAPHAGTGERAAGEVQPGDHVS